MWYGNTMIILIAAITSINDSIYESAQLDGASSFQTYTQITLPLLRPMLLYTLVTSLIGGLQMYDIPQNLNMHPAVIYFGTTTIASIETVLMYVNQQAFGMGSNKQVGIASAVSVLLFLVTTILSILIFYIMRDRDAAKAKEAHEGRNKIMSTNEPKLKSKSGSIAAYSTLVYVVVIFLYSGYSSFLVHVYVSYMADISIDQSNQTLS